MLNVRVSDDTLTHMKALGIESFPFTPEELSKKFRELVKIKHPDKGGNEKDFLAITEAKRALDNLALGGNAAFALKEAREDSGDIFDFVELKACPLCLGKGKLEGHPERMECRTCNGTGHAHTKCNRCENGLFKTKSGKVVTCRACNGSTIFVNTHRKCPACKGRGASYVEREVDCGMCRGTGKIRTKIKPFNPVLRKGAVLI